MRDHEHSELEIHRMETSAQGTLGVLMSGGRLVCFTMEPPELGNRPDVSCIPAGRYTCRRTVSARFGETFEVTGVPGRTRILFHVGNRADDTRECVLPGLSVGELEGRRAVLGSGPAFQAILRLLSGIDAAGLEITEHCGARRRDGG